MADPKERAERVMLIDLARNDLGRVAEFGSIRVTEQMSIERYSHVMHIASHVIGKLRADQNAFTALRATSPARMVAGAPKIRAMHVFKPTTGFSLHPFLIDGVFRICGLLRSSKATRARIDYENN